MVTSEAPNARQVRGWFSWGLAVALVLGLSACSGTTYRGSELYTEGRLIDAAEAFERTEAQLASASEADRAEYGVYRGMTLLGLGDTERAYRWLSFAYQVEKRSPGSLGPEGRDLLNRGWSKLSQLQPREPVAGAGTAVAEGSQPAPGAHRQPVSLEPPTEIEE